jgi:hypothetical protein
MGLVISETQSDKSYSREFVKVPLGSHLARCYELIDLGTQSYEYQGTLKVSKKVMIKWEIHSEDEDGKATFTDKGDPLSQSEEYTLSMHEKSNLGALLRSWRGKDFTEEERRAFNLNNILGAWCMLSIVPKTNAAGKEFRNVGGATPVPAIIKKAGLPKGHNELRTFDLDKPDMTLYESFSEGTKAKINKSPEWQALSGKPLSLDDPNAISGGLENMDDDIPF